MLFGFTAAALAADKAQLDNRLHKLVAKFERMQEKPDKRIPAENLRRAQGLILLDCTKAGFMFAFQGGGGVAMVREPKSGQWGPVTFIGANEASLGFQIGGQQSFLVILLMNTNVTRMLTEANFEFGAEARGTAADASAGVEGTIASPEKASVLVYGDRSGLFGGAAIKGGVLSPDLEDNTIYYSRGLTANDILFGNAVKPTEAAAELARKITQYSGIP
jgi:lipid-binding SYLF domain-containing protein